MGSTVRSCLLLTMASVALMSCTSSRPTGTLVSLLDQIPDMAPAGPWRIVVYKTDGHDLQHHARGFRREAAQTGDTFIATEETTAFHFGCLIRPHERVLVHLVIGATKSQPALTREELGMVQVRSLQNGTEIASSESRFLEPETTLRLGADTDAADQLILEFELPAETTLPVFVIAAIAFEEEAGKRDIMRAETLVRRAGQITSRFFEGSWRESGGAVGLLQRKRFPFALDGGTVDGSTKECVALVGIDTLTCEIPNTDAEYHLRLWELGLEESAAGCSLAIEVENSEGWAPLCTFGNDGLIHVLWREIDSREIIPQGTQRIRFLFNSQSKDDVLFVAEPLLLPVAERRPEQLNLVLILLDTLRRDRLGLYGYTARPTSTRLDSLVNDRGFFLFDRAYASSPWTVPSIAKLFTSRYRDVNTAQEIPRSYTLLAEQMRRAGYYCAGFTGGLFLRFRGFEQGFHEYSWTRVSGKVEHSFPQATRWVIDDRTQPFFLFLHTYETHEPLTRDLFCTDLPHGRLGNLSRGEPLIPPTWLGWKCWRLSREESTYVQAAYDGAVRTACDATVDFLDHLGELGLWENTVVVITSDHGEEFWDHFHGFSKHGHSLYGELLDVPLLLYVPELSTTRLHRVGTEVSLVDLVPTLGELLGIRFPEPLDGISLCPLLCSDNIHRTSPILATHRNENLDRTLRVCSIAAGIKCIEPLATQNVSASPNRACFQWKLKRELYNLERDPCEQNNEVLLRPTMADTLAARAKEAFEQSVAPTALPSDTPIVPSLPQNLKKQLKAVGYLTE